MESEPRTTTFNERMVLVQLVTITVVYAAYFVALSLQFLGGGLHLFFAMCAVHTIITLASTVVLRHRGEKQPFDERDVAIDRRCARVGYLTLICLIFALVFGVLIDEQWKTNVFPTRPAMLINAALLCVAIAEVVRYSKQLMLYRGMA